ncbi:Hypothetical predicted protein [Paramuricea clavata]|uniref:Uncharacterized protein n=1 Tax=Paramuricea clavata TaxID=317549 RepID=A0A6S7ITR1_PARCT|nr:Hypothetical predicted protein [Paramuricea clavata]
MAIKKNGKIAILNHARNILYIGNVCVELNSFKVDKSFSLRLRESDIHAVRFSSFAGTIVATGQKDVYIYTENRELQRTIENPTGCGYIASVAINHITKHTLLKINLSPYCSLLSFSETGESRNSVYLGSSEWIQRAGLKSHPKSPVALVGKTRAVLLQL